MVIESIKLDTITPHIMCNETAVALNGQERLKYMFSLDEFGRISSELNSVYQAGILGLFTGAVYGGIIQSRAAYIDFLEKNDATAFKSHLDAKRVLQDRFTVNFAKGAFKWGWRIALFTTTYSAITTCISVYRGKSSIYEYLAAGSISGAVYKINLGVRGIVTGSLLGCTLGGVAGALSLMLLKISGTSMEEVRYWQYKWKLDRESAEVTSLKAREEEKDNLLKAHDEKINKSVRTGQP